MLLSDLHMQFLYLLFTFTDIRNRLFMGSLFNITLCVYSVGYFVTV